LYFKNNECSLAYGARQEVLIMGIDRVDPGPQTERPYQIVGLQYVSLYLEDFEQAISFYTQVFGNPTAIDQQRRIYGWHMGNTWLTLFTSVVGTVPGSNPRNTEFAIQVAVPDQVDQLYQALISAGATICMAPADTEMYEPMRFACVDDPFGVRIDVYCPHGQAHEPMANQP
jgi:uncharacterized glyoxalase superfamily protein PhnB